MGKITVKMFELGTELLNIEVESGATVSDVMDIAKTLAGGTPGGASALEGKTVKIGLTPATADTVVKEGDVVMATPNMKGGSVN